MFFEDFAPHFNALDQGLQTTVHKPYPAREAVSPDPRKHFVTNEKIYYIYEKLVYLVKCNISCDSHIT